MTIKTKKKKYLRINATTLFLTFLILLLTLAILIIDFIAWMLVDFFSMKTRINRFYFIYAMGGKAEGEARKTKWADQIFEYLKFPLIWIIISFAKVCVILESFTLNLEEKERIIYVAKELNACYSMRDQANKYAFQSVLLYIGLYLIIRELIIKL